MTDVVYKELAISSRIFQVAVNGAHFGAFPHRVSLHMIKYLEIEAAIAIDQVSSYSQVVSLFFLFCDLRISYLLHTPICVCYVNNAD